MPASSRPAWKVELPARPVAPVVTGRNLDMDLYTRAVTGQDAVVGDCTTRERPAAGLGQAIPA